MNKPENAAYKRDDFTFTFFAYQSTLNPPFSVGPDGTVNASGDLKSPDGVKVKAFTAFSSLDYAHTTDYPANAAESRAEYYAATIALIFPFPFIRRPRVFLKAASPDNLRERNLPL